MASQAKSVACYLCVCQKDDLKNIKRINMKICGTNGHCPRTKLIKFWLNLDKKLAKVCPTLPDRVN